MAGVGAATASIIQGDLDSETLLNQAPNLEGLQKGLGAGLAEDALSVGCAFADEEEARAWAGAEAAAAAYVEMPRHAASLVGNDDRARLFPVRSSAAFLCSVEAPWRDWRDRLLRLRFHTSLEHTGAGAGTGAGGANQRVAAATQRLTGPGFSGRTASSGSGSGSRRSSKTTHLFRLARRLSTLPDASTGGTSDGDDEEHYTDDKARGLRWDEEEFGGDRGTLARRCVRRVLAAARPEWWRFRTSDRNPDIPAASGSAGGLPAASASPVTSILSISEGARSGSGSASLTGSEDDGELGTSLGSSFIPVPELEDWDDDDDIEDEDGMSKTDGDGSKDGRFGVGEGNTSLGQAVTEGAAAKTDVRGSSGTNNGAIEGISGDDVDVTDAALVVPEDSGAFVRALA